MITEFEWKNEESHQKILFVFVNVPVGIRTGHFLDTSQRAVDASDSLLRSAYPYLGAFV